MTAIRRAAPRPCPGVCDTCPRVCLTTWSLSCVCVCSCLVCVCVFLRPCACILVSMCVCMYVCMHACFDVCMYVKACVCMQGHQDALRRVGAIIRRVGPFIPRTLCVWARGKGRGEEEREKGGGRVEANPSAHAHALINAHAHIRSAALQEPMRANSPSSPRRCFSCRALVSHIGLLNTR
jgi:hypothetical protein